MGHPRRHPFARRRVVQGKEQGRAVGAAVARGTGPDRIARRGAGRGAKKQLQQTAARAVAIISRAGLTAADFSGKSRSFANYFFTVAAGELKPYGATVAKMAAAPEGWGAKGSPAQALAPELQPLLREMCDIWTPTARAGTPATC